MNPESEEDELRSEYDFDFSKAVRGKYYEEYRKHSNIVVLDPDIAEVFHNSEEVNNALRVLLKCSSGTAGEAQR